MTPKEESLVIDELLRSEMFVGFMRTKETGSHVSLVPTLRAFLLAKLLAYPVLDRDPTEDEMVTLGESLLITAKQRGLLR